MKKTNSRIKLFYHCFTTMVERVQGQYING
jgi:hypothetical protein